MHAYNDTKIIYSKVTTEPSAEPILLADAKTALRVDHNEEDSLIALLIQVCREIVEQRTGRSFITQSRTIKLDYFPRCGNIKLTYPPLISVTSVKYYDEDGVLQTLSSSDYWVDSSSNIPRIVIKNYWPATFTMPNAVEVIYSAGYGASGTSVPARLKQAMYLYLGNLYENRENADRIMHEIPNGAEELMSEYVVEQSVVY